MRVFRVGIADTHHHSFEAAELEARRLAAAGCDATIRELDNSGPVADWLELRASSEARPERVRAPRDRKRKPARRGKR